MPSTIGGNTQTIFFKGFLAESALFEEFVANATIKQGQFVKIDTNGEVGPISANDHQTITIGVAMQDAVEDGNVTVAMRGIGTILAEGAASMDPGPVKIASFTSGTGLNRLAAASATTYYVAASSGGEVTTALSVMDKAMIGWSLDASADAGDQVRLVVKN